jgi:NAD-dependent deacetylase
MDETLAELAAELRSSETAVALTGAGVSVASGIPPFRGEGGIWEEQFDPADFRIGRFVRDPAGFWADRLRLYEVMLPDDVRPNAAHEALARLEAAGYLDAVVTQNTDGHHLDAGSERVIELHGTNRRVICHACGRTTDAGPVRDRARDGELPPRCESCGGAYKPDVVLFGETLPGDAFREARRLAAESDVFFALGS